MAASPWSLLCGPTRRHPSATVLAASRLSGRWRICCVSARWSPTCGDRLQGCHRARRTPMQPVQLSLIPDPVQAPITGAALTVELTPMVEQLPAEAVATAIALLANVIAKSAAATTGSQVARDE